MKKKYHTPLIETKMFATLQDVMFDVNVGIDSGIHNDPGNDLDQDFMDENGIVQ